TFTVTLSSAPTTPVTIGWATADGTATAGSGDYVAASGTVSFAAGETSKTITVTVNGDTIFEANEAFSVALSGPVGAVIGTGTGRSRPGGTGGTSRPTSFVVTVPLSAPAPYAITVTLATGPTPAPLPAGTAAATAGTDYTTATFTVTFAPGQTSATVTVMVVG